VLTVFGIYIYGAFFPLIVQPWRTAPGVAEVEVLRHPEKERGNLTTGGEKVPLDFSNTEIGFKKSSRIKVRGDS